MLKIRFFIGVFFIFTALFLRSSFLEARMEPKWEAGLAVTDILAPHYPGSNEYYSRKIVLPFGIYRSDNLELGGGIKFFESLLGVDVSLSLGLKLPVTTYDTDDPTPDNFNDPNSFIIDDKNYRRRGMDGIPWLIGVGAEISKNFNDHFGIGVSFLNYRTLGEGFISKGFSATPAVKLNVFNSESNYILRLIYAHEYVSSDLADLFYSVGEKDVLPDRSFYKAEGGLIGTSTTGIIGYRYGRFRFFAFYSVDDLSDSVVADSPLVISDKGIQRGFGITYSFFSSDEKVFRGVRHR